MTKLENIFWLGTKELRSFFSDFVLLGLIVYAFSLAVIAQARSNSQEVYNASIAIVDEDHSQLSRRITYAFLPPYFQLPHLIAEPDIVPLMNVGKYTFVVDIPPNLERDVVAAHHTAIQVNVDATTMVQAGLGAGYIQRIITSEVADFLSHAEGGLLQRVNLAVRIEFNPNITTAWFTSVTSIINNVTMLAIILAGAALIREREHGTMDHLLVMPLTGFEIAMAKVWANGLVITIAVALSLYGVVRMLLGVPIAGSIPLFMIGVMIYLFFATAIGIFLGTVARSMPQLGLLFMLVYLPMNMLSGSNTPLESMPPWLATANAGVAINSFRIFCAGDPLSRRRNGRGLAGIRDRRADRRPVFRTRHPAFPVRSCAGEQLNGRRSYSEPGRANEFGGYDGSSGLKWRIGGHGRLGCQRASYRRGICGELVCGKRRPAIWPCADGCGVNSVRICLVGTGILARTLDPRVKPPS
jgi:ABC-2 type transport system permease protein